jgi:hypothetical protein
MLLLTSILPYGSFIASAIVTAVKGSSAGAGWWWVLGLSGLGIVLQQTVISRFYRLSQANPWLAPTWIIGAVVCIGMLINAMLKLKGRTTINWRGTVYRGETVAQPQS